MPPFDLGFFDDAARFRKPGMAWYEAQFLAWQDEPVVGESTPTYVTAAADPALVAARIDVSLPDVRLVAVVRQPVERMYSAMLYHIKRGRLSPRKGLFEMIRDQDPAVAQLDLVGGGLYGQNLAPFRRLFDDRLLIVVFDDLREDPHRVYDAVLRHIGADPSFVPPDLEPGPVQQPPVGAGQARVPGPAPADVQHLPRRRRGAGRHPRPGHVRLGPRPTGPVALMAHVPTLPNFVILGAAGCATRWLRFHLNEHPDVYLPTHPVDFFAEGVPPYEGPALRRRAPDPARGRALVPLPVPGARGHALRG